MATAEATTSDTQPQLGAPVTTTTTTPTTNAPTTSASDNIEPNTASTSSSSPSQPLDTASASPPNLTVTPASPSSPTSADSEVAPAAAVSGATSQIAPEPQTTAPDGAIDPASTQTPTDTAASTTRVNTTATEMKEKLPTDSETALVSNNPPPMTNEKQPEGEASAAAGSATGVDGKSGGAIENLTRKLSGKGKASKTDDSTAGRQGEKPSTAQPTSTSSTTANPTSSSSPSTQPAASTSRPARSAVQPTAQKKKRKRTGFAGFLLALGCLSAADFEDEEPVKKPVSTGTGAAAVKASGVGGGKEKVDEKAGKVDGAKAKAGDGTSNTAAGTTPAQASSNGSGNKVVTATTPTKGSDVVVAPATPVSLPDEETAGVTSGAVQQPGSGSELLTTPHRSSSNRDVGLSESTQSQAQGSSSAEAGRTETSGGYSDISESDMRSADDTGAGDENEGDYPLDEEYEDEEDRLIAQGGMGIPLDEHGQPAPLLPEMEKYHVGRKCLVLDLDETLLHSSFKMLPNADYIVPVEIEGQTHNVYVIKRPGVDNFLKEMGRIYEVVVFTASLSKYADPVLDMLDVERVVTHRLFRESCYNHKGNYVKDLSQLGRDIHDTIIIDNSPASYIFHPNNAVPVSTWFNDPHDTELTDLCPFLADLSGVMDVRGVLDGSI